jgi:PadR family transcriptional regulator PadR
MATRERLGAFQLLVLLAVIRLENKAYGVPIANFIEESSHRRVSVGSLYLTLERLESQSFLTSRLGDSTPERGGRAKTYYHITGRGLCAVRQTQRRLQGGTA